MLDEVLQLFSKADMQSIPRQQFQSSLFCHQTGITPHFITYETHNHTDVGGVLAVSTYNEGMFLSLNTKKA